VSGRFDDFDASIRMDRENPANSSVELTINAARIDTDLTSLRRCSSKTRRLPPDAPLTGSTPPFADDVQTRLTPDRTFLPKT